ncbi:helix-turn-helix transcriptional regulator [Streptomyces sp. MUM 203J]|uniref:helix-turn-helix transcriptional regulator n=1 Tax=Streptomyces sp. MUM 203J TaxID=2791990 RepID=UPI001F0432C1|nr:helix-turn-helix transcriptional regulator [Streptomyces sp. MUM 203J]MCH0538252.1 helix-turn-helix transcriptional regulator [Streptomyces sp. MUM 203J]
MPPVFAHGRLRLYLLKLLDEAPRHGYEVIRLLEERFQGLYAPSAGTVYPRLAKLEAEGLVTHASEGGRKVYSITEAGRAELAARSGELADLEQEIRESVSELASEIRDDVRGAAGRLRSEMRAAASETRQPGGGPEWEAWRSAKEELRRAKQEWKEQTRRARDESRRAREEAQNARRQAKEAQDRARQEMQRLTQQVQERVAQGDWPKGVRDGLTDLTSRLGGLFAGPGAPGPGNGTAKHPADGTAPPGAGTPPEPYGAEPYLPGWAHEEGPGDDPARELERLLDRFRDDVRDAARDHGVTEARLTEARAHLAAAAARITALLRADGVTSG